MEGYFDVIKEIGQKYGSLSLIEFDGYFEGKFEPAKYTRVEVHTAEIDLQQIIEYANEVRVKLNQESMALEFNNRLLLVTRQEDSLTS